MVQLIPSHDTVLQMLKRTGAFREGHFVYPNGKHSPHYFQMPLAFRYYDTARVLAVALSRRFRVEKTISSQLPKVSVISPSSGGIPVAFGVRDALNAEQIYWAEQESDKQAGQRRFSRNGADGGKRFSWLPRRCDRFAQAIDGCLKCGGHFGDRT